jgi:hypothetical protein
MCAWPRAKSPLAVLTCCRESKADEQTTPRRVRLGRQSIGGAVIEVLAGSHRKGPTANLGSARGSARRGKRVARHVRQGAPVEGDYRIATGGLLRRRMPPCHHDLAHMSRKSMLSRTSARPRERNPLRSRWSSACGS